MSAARANAPTLAWLLTALTCLLAGMAIVESRHQAVALPVWAPVGPVESGEVAVPLAPTPESARTPTIESASTPLLGPGAPFAPSRTLLSEAVLAWPVANTAILRLEWLTVPPGTGLPAETASHPMVLVVESGTLAGQVERAVWVGSGLEAAYPSFVLRDGQGIVVAAGARYTVRNDAATPAVALVVTILPGGTSRATPMPGS
jgi:hypothetical protein